MKKNLLEQQIAIFWFRRDLRLQDNNGLFQALKNNQGVLPIFIFDTNILGQLEDPYDRRLHFIHQALTNIQSELNSLHSDIKCYHGDPLEIFKKLVNTYNIHSVYCNHDYEPYANERDLKIQTYLGQNGVHFLSFKDQCIFEKNEVTKDDGKPYTVFTPYSKKWKATLTTDQYVGFKSQDHFKNFLRIPKESIISLTTLGFKKTNIQLNNKITVSKLLLEKYKSLRDIPSAEATSGLSIYLRFGVISIRELVAKSIYVSETWLNELIWREFYMMILWHFPHVVSKSFKTNYEQIQWLQDESGFEKWCNGQTGFPIVDAGMRELNATGFMHNRVRMIVSSFLVKDLLIDWRWGEAYFAKKLNDFDLSANNGGWQWAAGSGCDAAPYFRIFNPTEQQKKFDPDFIYIKKWVPEFGTNGYCQPIVDHKLARLRTLAVYKKALNQFKQIELF